MKKRKGFTLVEVMVAIIVIITVAIVGFEFFLFCQRSVTDISLSTVALNRAREIMEKNYLDSTPTNQTLLGIPGHTGEGEEGKVEVTDSDSGKYKTITVRVTWN